MSGESSENASNENGGGNAIEPEARPGSKEGAAIGGRGSRDSRSRRRRLIGWLGIALTTLGLLLIGYAAIINFFGDPITGLYQDWRQRQMAGELNKTFTRYRPLIPDRKPDAPRSMTASEARRLALHFSKEISPGDPIGRIVIASIGVNEVVVNGTSTSDLQRGPGRYSEGSYPGLGKVTAIAGHRTTYGAPFMRIEEIHAGDDIRVEMPYATFTYRVFSRRAVDDQDWSILRPRPFEALVLSACHPRYRATQRWIVSARLVSVAAPPR